MKIEIETIPHSNQRYSTCGDWFERDGVLHIRASEEVGEDHAFLIALHELIEWKLCQKNGISERDVDLFDKGYEAARKAINPEDNSEPGESPDAPYSNQHAFATAMEEKMASEMKVLWSDYASAVNKLP